VAIQDKNFSKAIEYFEEYLEHCPNDSAVFWKLAYAKKHTGDLTKAIELIEAALKQSDKHSYLLHYNYACYLALAKNPISEVIEQLTIALDLDKGNNLSKTIIKDPDLINVSNEIEFTNLLGKYKIDSDSEKEVVK
jgi:tetratricopeptide (TPR) repeat protein